MAITPFKVIPGYRFWHHSKAHIRLPIIIIIIIIIIIERKDLGGVMSKDCKDTLQTLKTVTKRERDAK